MERTYDPQTIEGPIYARWEAAGYFEPNGDGPAYCIMLPPPNVTGTLHMGHAFQHTLMDALVRYHRMRGARVLWQAGTDHAGIATQMVVERQLAAKGTDRHALGRAAFIERVERWQRESGGIITQQMRRLGDSVDWTRERFTLEPALSDAVTEEFVRLYERGLIYRGKRLVNWDPVLHTALSDLEVVNEEENGDLWHIRYPLDDGDGYLVVATTRPETMLGDVAIAVHPDDERYRSFIGKQIRLPLTGRLVPIIADAYVEREFGSGCVKITPAHDFNDYAVGVRHGLTKINIFDAGAAVLDAAECYPPDTDASVHTEPLPAAYRGLDRFEARKRIVADLARLGLLEKTEAHALRVPRGDRSGAVLEPWLTDQWFVDLTREKTPDGRPGGLHTIVQPAIEAVRNGRIRFVPEGWSKTYFNWLGNIQDWCISRQLWWGHRIPAWYDETGKVYVARSETEAHERHGVAPGVKLHQDEDVLDTWFSAASWPFSTLGWPDKTEDLKTFYPTNVLVTGFDIIFFWVARMVMMGLAFTGEVPFREVYITGLIRDEHGQKMSKSKGNVLDPIDLIDGIELDALIAKRTRGMMQPQLAGRVTQATRREFPNGIPAFGTDALRFTFAALASTGRDINFDLGRVEGYRHFCNKLWNATRFVLMHVNEAPGAPVELAPTDRWIRSRLAQTIAEVRGHLDEYRFDLAAQALYDYSWSKFCDWYLELVKPRLGAGGETADAARNTLIVVLEALLRLLHPLMPFITEALWERVAPLAGRAGASIMLAPWPEAADFDSDPDAEAEIEWVQTMVATLRQLRAELGLDPARRMPVTLHGASLPIRKRLERHAAEIAFLARTEMPNSSDEPVPEAAATAVIAEAVVAVPMAGLVDIVAELARLEQVVVRLERELSQTKGKLANETFRNRAPAEVVAREEQRRKETETALAGYRSQRERLERLR
ncbi:MAG: valine--tRNA ligase [Gammaproteobacteria bacterium]